MSTDIQQPGWVVGFFQRVSLSFRTGLALVLLVTIATHLPMPFGNLSTDDFLIRANIMGNTALYERGLINANPGKPLLQRLGDAFHFYSPEQSTLQAAQEYGSLPWWSSQEAKMSPLRPVSALTHWLDFHIAPASFQFQAFHSLLYLLLYAYCGYRLFWRISPTPTIAVLASLLLVVDYSHYINFSWIAARNVFIAGAMSCAMLERFIAWRQSGHSSTLAASLALFAIALLAAESSIAITGYLFAYLLFIEKTKLINMIRPLLPFALMVILWRFIYSFLGYGASGISLYVDPGHSPHEFISALLITMPQLLASSIIGIDGAVPSLSPDITIWAAIICGLIAILCLRLILPLLQQNEWVRFMLLGSLIAAIPASALVSAGSRGGLFISIGFFWILSMWLHQATQKSKPKRTRFLASGVIGLHLIVPTLLAFLLSSTLLPIAFRSDMQFESIEKSLRNDAKPLVVINSRAPNREFYLPYQWQFQHGVTPTKINSLAPGITSFYLERLSELDFELTAPQGLPLTSKAPITDMKGNSPTQSEVYYIQLLQGLFTSLHTQYYKGTTRKAGDMRITVVETTQGSPSRIRINFTANADPDQMIWQMYDWEQREYKAISPLDIGEKRFFPGPVDIDKGNLFKLCWNCEQEKPTQIDN